MRECVISCADGVGHGDVVSNTVGRRCVDRWRCTRRESEAAGGSTGTAALPASSESDFLSTGSSDESASLV
eukprot:SAG11_NODE_4261_length_1982_cov_49.484865_3_plen_71_part_00